MTESSQTRAPVSRRTKKTVPKPPVDLTPKDTEEEELLLRDIYKRLVYTYTRHLMNVMMRVGC